jgi:trigger factor
MHGKFTDMVKNRVNQSQRKETVNADDFKNYEPFPCSNGDKMGEGRYKIKEGAEDELKVVVHLAVPGEAIAEVAEAKIEEESKTFKMAGFREGAVPKNLVRKRIGVDILSKEIERGVDESLKEFFEHKGWSPAAQPHVNVEAFSDKSYLVYTLTAELLPPVPEVNWEEIKVKVLKIKISDEDIKKAHEDIIKNFKNFVEAEEGYAAQKGDSVVINFKGSIDGEEFEGGSGEEVRLEIGSGTFVPGFEEQLIGARKGDKKIVEVTFPENYPAPNLANKKAQFDVEVLEVLKPEGFEVIDDEFAKKLGVESLEQLNELIKGKLEADYEAVLRMSMKKSLFDQIDEKYKFNVPQKMLDADFEIMWREISAQARQNPELFDNKPLSEIEKTYRDIAARRVRLGIILADLAKKRGIEVEEADLQQAVVAEAMQRPGQEKMVFDFYKNPENLERLKGPLLEEKAVDLILEMVTKEEEEITSDKFMSDYAEAFRQPPITG